jgi:hypothetical protein
VTIKEQHQQAMHLAQEALLAHQSGDSIRALALNRQAFALERAVAMSFFEDETNQPTRAVLFRSAATLAKDCGDLNEAQRLISDGLPGAPAAIVAELKALNAEIEQLRQQPKPVAPNQGRKQPAKVSPRSENRQKVLRAAGANPR